MRRTAGTSMADRFHIGGAPARVGAEIVLGPAESHHLLKVMRARVGDAVGLFGAGREYQGVVCGIAGREAVARIESELPALAPPRIAMWFGLPWLRGDHLETAVQKLTELGARGIYVFHVRREVARGGDARLGRLRRVALEACKQCGRADVPAVSEAVSAIEVVERAALGAQRSILLYEAERVALIGDVVRRALTAPGDPAVLMLSGPEGGFDPGEVGALGDLVTRASLGPRILRAATAPVVAAACALTVSGDM
jgi:16S rRNA (uracil1498-N3)-methyltransferase